MSTSNLIGKAEYDNQSRKESDTSPISRLRPRHPKRKLLILSVITSILIFFLLFQERYNPTDVLNQGCILIGDETSEKQIMVVRNADEAASLSSQWGGLQAGTARYIEGSNSTSSPLKDLKFYKLMVQNATFKPPLLTIPIIKAVQNVKSEIKTHFKKRKIDINFIPGEAIPMNKIRRILIVSTWRSGSTFLGDMLSSQTWTFYNYEPLILYDRYPDIQPDEIEKFFRLVRDIFTCNFAPHVDYIQYINKYKFLIAKNLVMKKICALSKENLCHDPDFHSEVCRYLPYNIVKTVRADLVHFEPLLEDLALDLRVIYLIRDPRGVFNSRKKTTWCSTEMCHDVPLGCQNMLSNLKMAEIYQNKYPGRFHAVRFEDLCLFPEQTTKQILEVAGLPYQGEIETFLKAHTRNTISERNKYAYGTFRKSADVAFKWRKSFSFENVEEVQENCHEVLDLLGMTYFYNEVDYKNMSIPMMKDNERWA